MAISSSYSLDLSVDRAFSARAQAMPDVMAIVGAQENLSYGELDARSNRLARRLRGLGVNSGDFVGLLAQRASSTIVAFLAILKLGAAYVPLDPAYPADLLDFMLTDCNPALVLAQRSLAAKVKFGAVFEIEAVEKAAAEESGLSLQILNDAGNVAYVMYTSGSTGRPKGVVIRHRGIVRLVTEQDYADFGPDEVFLHMAPLAFDASTFEIWGALLNGGRITIIQESHPSLDQIGVAIKHFEVTTAWFTAGLFHLLVEEHLEALRPLRRILSGGDVLSPSHVEKLYAALPDVTLVNGYGPTENTTFTCCYEIPRQGWGGGSIPIGTPIAHTEVYILGADLKPVANDEAGQLCVGGDGLALGYLNRPDLTREKFIRHPFAGAPNESLYLTGDLARWRPDGLIEFLGRADRQVKINGKRVELDEIENVLRSDSRLADAAVMRIGDPEKARLVAYMKPVCVLAATEHDAFGNAILGALRTKLPEHMVPSTAIILDAFPLTPNGKVDRKRLPAPAPRRLAVLQADLTMSSTEERLAIIWQQVLAVPEIGLTSTFFELGGNSLGAIRLIRRVQETFGMCIPITTIYEAPTIKAMAALIDTRSRPVFSPLVRFKAGDNETAFFIVHGAGGNVMELFELAGRMDYTGAVYFVQGYGLDGAYEPFERVEDMARAYISAIREVQLRGPYRLAGYSFGGLVAFEMARLLQAEGESIGFLGLLDTTLHMRHWTVRTWFGAILWWFRRKYNRARELLLGNFTRWLTGEDVDSAHSITLPQPLQAVADAAFRARAIYNPEFYNGTITLHRCTKAMLCDPALNWAGLSRQLVVRDIPCGHYDLIHPPVVDLVARELSQSLRESLPDPIPLSNAFID